MLTPVGSTEVLGVTLVTSLILVIFFLQLILKLIRSLFLVSCGSSRPHCHLVLFSCYPKGSL